ncbi:hypothetical protein PA598K_01326 [Paenibacillus sp. 598K]|uniref:hypothetical protein n=1 Tax=Paenibacillus sp. 598K TaxID=1117987 RepID=UPI000FF9C7F7|nr:hypothetical protein [Paenibacillus sp. 598K]GBF73041.1 hypothetical protein PA598K_01326 [Paenibacillus sp. 598K]
MGQIYYPDTATQLDEIVYNHTYNRANPDVGKWRTSTASTNLVSWVRFSPSGNMLAVAYSANYSNQLIEIYRKTAANGWAYVSNYLAAGKTLMVDWVHDGLIVFTESDATPVVSIYVMPVSADGILSGTRTLVFSTTVNYVGGPFESTASNGIGALKCSPDGRWITCVVYNGSSYVMRGYRVDSDTNFVSVLNYSLGANKSQDIAWSADSKHLFAIINATSSNIKHFMVSSSTSLAFYTTYSTSVSSVPTRIDFSRFNNGYFAIATESTIIIGLHNGSSSVSWIGSLAYAWIDGAFNYEGAMSFHYDVTTGGFILYGHRGATDRNILFGVSATTPNTITQVASIVSGYGTSNDIDRLGRYYACADKSGSTFAFEALGTSTGRQMGFIMSDGKYAFIPTTVKATYPPRAKVGGNVYELPNR